MKTRHELAALMQEIDQNLAATKRQVHLDSYGLEASYDLFDQIEQESLYQMALLKGETVDKTKDTAVVLQARLMSDDEDW